MEQKLVKYIRDEKRRPRGMVVALRNGPDTWSIGWSLCHRDDEYDPRIARTIAESRAMNISKSPQEYASYVPESMVAEIETMYDRATRYFKGMRPMWELNDFLE